MASAFPSIAIIGAGLSGLTLGLCLKQRGIAAVLYDRAISLPCHNYGIVLHPSTYRPLLSVLHIDETTFREKLSVNGQQSGNGSLSGTSISAPTDAFRCHRGRLEALLNKDLSIKWNKRLKDVQLSSQSKGITASFDDGYKLKTKCLVGCDGPHSMTRQSLSPAMKPQVLPYVVFNGKRSISFTEYVKTLHDYMVNNESTQTRKGDIRLEISVNDISTSHVDLNYTYSRPAQGSHDPLHKADRPISGATDIPEEFFDELAALHDLEPPFQAVFDAGKVRNDRVLHWLMRTLTQEPSEAQRLAEHNVVLIGDAVHLTPILGGEGANMANRDGIELAQHIATRGIDTLNDFSESKFEEWKYSVDKSRDVIREMHTPPDISSGFSRGI